MKKIILLASVTVFLISCTKTSYTISGTAKGVDNGKTVILETQDAAGMGLIAVDTVKIENGKFEIKGKAAEPSIHLVQVEGVQGKFPFILENGSIEIEINKDSINKSKVSGTYSNDEFVNFNKELEVLNKDLMSFQTKNTPVMTQAQQTNDTATMNKLMADYRKIQEVVNTNTKKKYNDYVENHPKSFITVLILQGMVNDPSIDVKKVEKIFASLDESIKKSKPGKAVETKLKEKKTPSVGTVPPPPAPADAK